VQRALWGFGRGVEGLVEATEGLVPIIGVFALRIGMVDNNLPFSE